MSHSRPPYPQVFDIIDSISDAFYAVDREWRFVVFNRAAEAFIGISRSEVLGKELWSIFPQGRGTPFEAACNAAATDGAIMTVEAASALRPGHFVELLVGPLSGGGATVAIRDVTERVIARQRLEELSAANEKLAAELETVLTNLVEGVILADREGRVTFVNEAAARLHGVNELGVSLERYSEVYRLFTEDGEPYPVEALPLMRAARHGETVVDAKWRIRRADGVEIRAMGSARPIFSADGQQTGATLTIRDDTQRQLTEERLRLTSQRLDAILSNTRMAVFLMDERQHCAYMNDAAEKLTGYRWEETRGRPLHDVIHHTRPDGSHFPLSECVIDRAFPENNHQQGEEVFVHKDGHFYPVAFTASPIRDAAAHTVGTIIEVRDITQEKIDERTRELLVREVDHRSRNSLMVVHSIMRLSKANDLESFREAVLGRVGALALAQGSLAKRQWQNAPLDEVLGSALSALGEPDRFTLTGPEVLLQADQVQPVSMLAHELATNARKYGALSVPDGHIDVQWSAQDGDINVTWREENGPPVKQPATSGFGSRLIRELSSQLRGHITIEWESTGLRAHLKFPLSPKPSPDD